MYNIVSKLLIYGDMDEESILMQLSDIFRCMDEGSQTKDVLRTRVFKQVKRILEVATDYGFDKNLWQNYLTYFLITIIRWYIHLFYLCNFTDDFFYFPAVFICNFHTHCLF